MNDHKMDDFTNCKEEYILIDDNLPLMGATQGILGDVFDLLHTENKEDDIDLTTMFDVFLDHDKEEMVRNELTDASI